MLSTFVQMHPKQASSSDAYERLWDIYYQLTLDALDSQRWVDVAVLHESVWSSDFRNVVQDWTYMARIAEAYEQLGLPNRAVVVLRDAVSMLVAEGEDDPEVVLHLAQLYFDTSYLEDGLRSLSYLLQMKPNRATKGKAYMLAANIHEAAGDDIAAASELRKAALMPEHRVEATVSLAVMDAEAGRCARSSSTLERVLFTTAGKKMFNEPRPWLALARCLAAQGNPDGAAVAAKEAAKRTSSKEEQRYATWIAGVADGWRDPELVDSVSGGDDVWAALANDNLKGQEFEEALERRREQGWKE